MQTHSFIGHSSSLSISVTLDTSPVEGPRHELIKIYLVGSLAGIKAVKHSLHRKNFAEVNEWSKPQPTSNPGEYISVLFRHILLD
jgi:hypothetical protein